MLAVRDLINRDLTNFMFTQGYALSPNTKNPHSLDSWVFYFQNSGGNKDNIKIEINYSMRNHILPIVKRKVNGNFLQIDFEVKTLAILELFGGKIKALIERTAPRDLYDIHNMLNQNIIEVPEQDMLRKIVLFYLSVGGSNKPSTTFNFDNLHRLKFPQIRSSLIPVLKKSERFDFEIAKEEVKEYLSNLFILTEKEKLYVENFNQGIYQPELLFEETDIIERIKEHPMAVWKMKGQ
jgi:predicted nucleotidyltransferase component of viral defense system